MSKRINKVKKFIGLIIIFIFVFNIPSSFSMESNVSVLRGSDINAHGGGIIKIGSMYYWYGELRGDGIHNYGKVSLYKSNNLKNWHYVGIILNLSSLEGKYSVERPKIIYNKKNKKFVMWFHIELHGKYNTGLAGVAISKKIEGPFNFLRQIKPNKKSNPIYNDFSSGCKKNRDVANNIFTNDKDKGQMFRDFTIYQDGDKAYIIYESENNFSLHISLLDNNFTNFSGDFSRIIIGGKNEAPALMKFKNKYYLFASGLNGFNPTVTRLYESDNVLGQWKYLGIAFKSDDLKQNKISFGSQTSFVFYDKKNDKWFYFADKWDRKNLINSNYLVTQVLFDNNVPYLNPMAE